MFEFIEKFLNRNKIVNQNTIVNCVRTDCLFNDKGLCNSDRVIISENGCKVYEEAPEDFKQDNRNLGIKWRQIG